MDIKLFGVVIKVCNLGQCKSFYRDVLDLGAPVMDSNFWVEFKLGDASLCLEKVQSSGKDPQKKVAENFSWIMKVQNLDDFVNRMSAYGYVPDSEECDSFGFALYRFRDPEGNPFMVSAQKK